MNTTRTDTEILTRAIRAGIQQDTEKAFDEMRTKLIADLDARKNQIIAGVVLDVERLVNYRTLGENLVITVRKIEKV